MKHTRQSTEILFLLQGPFFALPSIISEMTFTIWVSPSSNETILGLRGEIAVIRQ